jgi:hypothetical protein
MLVGSALTATGSWSIITNGTGFASSKSAAQAAFESLQKMFAEVVFDLRENSFSDFHKTFGSVKEQVERLLNETAFDRRKLVHVFNQEACKARVINSKDNHAFDVRAEVNALGGVELLFMEM